MPKEVEQRSSIIREFSRFAHKYDKYNMIQAKVATTLVGMLSSKRYNRVLDIGCGSGEVFRNFEKKEISVEHFIALDSAQAMLDIHPSFSNITKVCKNFNQIHFLDKIPQKDIDIIISSSALQWSNNLDVTLGSMTTCSKKLYAAVFTSGTFATLHDTAGITSPIHNAEDIQKIILKHYSTVAFGLHTYRLKFETIREMFRYIKQSGVSSGERRLTYKQTKQLMQDYPLNYLEFEVLYVEATCS